jgi:hypothetical protein
LEQSGNQRSQSKSQPGSAHRQEHAAAPDMATASEGDLFADDKKDFF